MRRGGGWGGRSEVGSVKHILDIIGLCPEGSRLKKKVSRNPHEKHVTDCASYV